MPNAVLMLCYYFPPFARSGGMRSMQFGKRLVERGFDVHVVTAAPELYTSAVDPASTARGYESLPWAKVTHLGLPAGAGTSSSRSAEFAATLRDPWRLEGPAMRAWVDAATATCRAFLQQHPGTPLYIGLQPYAAALVGLRLQQELGTRWIADFADPWTLDEVCAYSSWLHFRRQQSAFRRVLKNANVVLANTPDAAAAMAAFEPSVRERMEVVTYGYDADALPAPMPPPPRDDGEFVLLHLGAIEVTGANDRRRNPLRHRPYTTDVAARGTHYLLQALELVRQRRPELFARLRLRIVSARTDNEFAAVRERGMADQFEWTGMLKNSDALAAVSRAHGALLLQQGAPAGHRLRTVRAKSYEYMALGKPILACVPGGDGRDFIGRYGRGITADPSSAEAIAAGILALHDRYDELAQAPVDEPFVRQFEWGALTDRLATALRQLQGKP
jgi:glycosyltransferase involved in cell wall biosynthesis